MKSLLDGLKLIWTISRHINHNVDQFEHILEAISNEICQKVREKINIKTIFKKKPEQAISDIEAGMQVLDKWHSEFARTRQEIENELTIARWDFTNQRTIFEKPQHMGKILENLKETCRIVKEFFAILSEELAAVTGSSQEIDQVKEKVKDQVSKLSNFVNDIFHPDNQEEWDAQFKNFTNAVKGIEDETIQLINRTFGQNLNSAAGAFDLLDNFNDVETRPMIRKEFEGKYSAVLNQYKEELHTMLRLFEENKHDPPIPKNMPPNSGAIAWARSVITRVKTPIDRFKTKPHILTGSPLGKEVAR